MNVKKTHVFFFNLNQRC